MYKLKIISVAQKELAKELAYSRKHWGKLHGKIYARELRARIRNLKENPKILQLRPDIAPGIRVLTYKGSRVVYKIYEDTKTVAIFAVLGHYQNISTRELAAREREL